MAAFFGFTLILSEVVFGKKGSNAGNGALAKGSRRGSWFLQRPATDRTFSRQHVKGKFDGAAHNREGHATGIIIA